MTDFEVPAWVRDAVFYQIFPDRFANGDPGNDPPGTVAWDSAPTRENFFGGDLQGILDRLPYLAELGVTALYLTPVFRARTNHKYDTCDYLAVDPAFGSEGLLRRLVTECHAHGLRVVLDAVFNHCGDGFWAFEDVRGNGAASRYRDWFHLTGFPLHAEPANYQTCGGAPYLPKLNTANPAVRDYLLRVATYWIEQCDIDGWRLDVPWKMPMGFWRAFRERVKRAKPEAYIVGEVWRNPQAWLQGDTCDGVMNYPLREYVLDYCVRDHMDAEDFDYELGLQRQALGPAAASMLNLLGSHDTPRLLTLCQGDRDRARLAATFLLTYTGAPMIYYGDEVGLQGGNDPDCRRPMPWDPAAWEPELHQLYRTLIGLRHRHPALRWGGFEPLLVFNAVYAYCRSAGDDHAVVVLNPREGRPAVRVPLPPPLRAVPAWRDGLSGSAYPVEQGEVCLDWLPPRAALVLLPQAAGDRAG